MQVRSGFDRELRRLQDEVLILGSMVENAIYRALDALNRRDLDAASRVVQEDDAIDRKRLEIEERCINLMATQQPIGRRPQGPDDYVAYRGRVGADGGLRRRDRQNQLDDGRRAAH